LFIVLCGQLKGDEELQEFLGVFDTKNRQVWKNVMGAATSHASSGTGTDSGNDTDDSEHDEEDVPSKEGE
jgi:hypothetical protein